MKNFLKTIFTLLAILQIGCKSQDDISFNGKTLEGYELMNDFIDEAKPEYKWYHKTRLIFKGDSVFIEQRPVYIYKSDSLHSESDGGFYYYKGIWKDQKQFEINAIETHCDYCPTEVKKVGKDRYKKIVRTKTYKGNKTIDGLNLNGIKFIINTKANTL